MKNLYKIISDQYGMEALYLVRDWGKTSDKQLWLQEPWELLHLDVSARELFKSVLD